jgi:hypothetical protein
VFGYFNHYFPVMPVATISQEGCSCNWKFTLEIYLIYLLFDQLMRTTSQSFVSTSNRILTYWAFSNPRSWQHSSNSRTATLPTLQPVGSQNLGPRTRSRAGSRRSRPPFSCRVNSSVVKNRDSKTPIVTSNISKVYPVNLPVINQEWSHRSTAQERPEGDCVIS